MATVTLNKVLQLAGALPEDEQELLVEIIRKRRAEAWRKEVANYARKASRQVRAGKLKGETAESLVQRLSNQWDDE